MNHVIGFSIWQQLSRVAGYLSDAADKVQSKRSRLTSCLFPKSCATNLLLLLRFPILTPGLSTFIKSESH
jgi:hypothetical protein